MAGYREHRSAELIAIDELTKRVNDMLDDQHTMLKIQASLVTIVGQIKEAVTPQPTGGDDLFAKLIGELLATSRAQVEGLARVERALAGPTTAGQTPE